MKIEIDSSGQSGSQKHRLSCDGAKGTHAGSLPSGRRVSALLRWGEEGSVLVEVSLLTPILLALVTAMCTFAVGFNNQLTLTQAVGAGAQYLQIDRGTADPCADTLTAIENAAPSLKGSSINLTINFNGTVVNANSCTGNSGSLVQSSPVTVSATYPCVLSIMPMGYGTKFVSNCQLSAKVTEYEY
jgi:Flp pilus assembly protein TadG